MSAKIDYSDIVGGFQIMAERIAAFESLSARLLSSESILANNRRDLKDRLDILAERIRRYFASAQALPVEGDEGGRRAARLFLAELDEALDESFRFAERRFGEGEAGGAPSGGATRRAGADAAVDSGGGAPGGAYLGGGLAEADRALRALSGDFAPAPGAADALGLVAARAAELRQASLSSKAEAERRLERELVAVKLKAFVETSRLARAERPELLFKAKLALERRLAAAAAPTASANASAGLIVAGTEARREGELALAPGPRGSIAAELLEAGLRIGIRFEPESPEALVAGFVEAGGERAVFGLGEAAGGRTSGFPAFLSRHELARLYEGLCAAAAGLKAAAGGSGAEGASGRLSSALDSLLGL
ncbi:MAG TPA: hypothetical protein P5165_02920 [Spirochaetia bacterium]|nr:hypothetical protein [Spirochaetia bacterium]